MLQLAINIQQVSDELSRAQISPPPVVSYAEWGNQFPNTSTPWWGNPPNNTLMDEEEHWESSTPTYEAQPSPLEVAWENFKSAFPVEVEQPIPDSRPHLEAVLENFMVTTMEELKNQEDTIRSFGVRIEKISNQLSGMSKGNLMDDDEGDAIKYDDEDDAKMDDEEEEKVGATESRSEDPVLENIVAPFPIEPLTKEPERKRHLEDIYFTMLGDDEKLLELDDAISSNACVECDGRNTCVVCAEISAYLEGDGFGNAESEDCTEARTAPMILSNYLPPHILKQSTMEFMPLPEKPDFGSLKMQAPWPVQEVEPHFYWEDFVDKGVIFDPRGIEKCFPFEEVSMNFERSLPHFCCKPWDPGERSHMVSIPWSLYHRLWDPGGCFLISQASDVKEALIGRQPNFS